MVKKKHTMQLMIVALVLLSLTELGFSYAQTTDIEYHLNHEWVKIWINRDGTIDLLYDIKLTCTQGRITRVDVGQPTNDFTIGEARDHLGNLLTVTDVSDSEFYAVRVQLSSPISAGQNTRFSLLTNVGHMIWEDEQNMGNVGMQFVPTWWDAYVFDLRMDILFPNGITTEEVKNTPDWNNAYNDPEEGNRLVLYWEQGNLQPNEKFTVAVSFPKEYVDHYEVKNKGLDWEYVILISGGVVFIAVIALFVLKSRKQQYSTPVIRMETMGVRRGLTAVEASHLMEFPPVKIVAEILFSLLMKKAIWVKSTEPALKIEIVKPNSLNSTEEIQLRYYEISFIRALRIDETLDEKKLAKTIMLLRKTVEAKLHGYCREDTLTYYKRIVFKAWQQVENAGTSELASKAYDENLLWIMLEKNIESETTRVFKDKTFTPLPTWWWYWYIFNRNKPIPKTQPRKDGSSPPPIPGADLANDIVTAIEKTANNIVINVEKFANSILAPPLQPKSRKPARRGASCICACAACACACACVSCACACASGGVG